MVRSELILLMHEVGKIFSVISNSEFSRSDLALSNSELEDFEYVVQTMERQNPWFTEAHIHQALDGLALWLEKEKLENWLSDYPFAEKPKNVAVIMAGNIPLVGFHDFLCVLMSGHHVLCKLSSQDALLWQAFFKLITLIDPRIAEHFSQSTGLMKDFDAVIATGSNNTAISFKHYFEKYPHIIRQNRTSVAVLTGDESDEELSALADDVFSYFGFGCRNVSQVFVPENFDVQRLFQQFVKYESYINHHKYMNNFDYYRSLYLLNSEPILENGFLLMRFNKELHAPPAVLNCHRYSDRVEVDVFIQENQTQIQAVVGKDGIAFGAAQCPSLTDYADGVDVMEFLSCV
jgi:hypothetical protein